MAETGPTAYSFNANTNTWTTLASGSATGPEEGAAAVSDGSRYIYILGGVTSATTAQSTNIRYDTTGNSYATEAAFPVSARWAAAAAYFNGNIYLMNGSNSAGSAFNNSLEIYNVAGNTWSAGATVPQSAAFSQATHINVRRN